MSGSGVFMVGSVAPEGDATAWPIPRRPVGIVFAHCHDNLDRCIDRFREQNPGVEISRLYVVSWARRYGHKIAFADQDETMEQAIGRYKTSGKAWSENNPFIVVRWVAPEAPDYA